ncbi:hypothetical protein [Mesorhizobium ventifaucium]|uniref:Porin n=1 Tax=Mesorhizobium ventifaucium TaxID=666020 RepID=A0ABN8JWI5_9HYPH|nr:hypothetical protein [Mesorhizobium ventifaucium]CAH2402067.1 conserved exported hypothetical protein [Mesorhizobium ventifaucium]
MIFNHATRLMLFVGGLGLATTGAVAQDTTKKPHIPLEKTIGAATQTGPVPSLAVVNSQGAKLEGGKLVLTGVSKNAIVFADRPVRAAGHVTTEQFIMQWDEGKDNFAIDPPNATVSMLGGDGSDISDVVVTLKTPKLEGTTLTFDVAVLEGNLDGATGPAAVFIDNFGGGFHGGGFHGSYAHVGDATFAHVGGFHGGGYGGGGYWHAPVYNGAWYGGARVAAGVAAGAAIGAAAAAPYYNPYSAACGYYPYPPCY